MFEEIQLILIISLLRVISQPMQRNRTLMNGVTLHDKIYKASLRGILERVGIRRVKKRENMQKSKNVLLKWKLKTGNVLRNSVKRIFKVE